ncbi:MAG: hypothetical protein IT330_08600 [Anaerolineae bacterium]|nr:hypothetical protein [Anaerolineae bacterium]
MPKNYTVHVIPHTHWDREWYGSFQQFRLRLVRLMDKLLPLLQNTPQYPYFNLDGQTAPLLDYLEIRPERRADLERLVGTRRLGVGPWFVLPDEFIPSAEAHVRNLMLGHRIARSFGYVQKIGYIPDTFGHIGQLPQILRGFGIDTALNWRGLDPGLRRSEAWWESPDGSRVLLAVLPPYSGYANAGPLPPDVTEAANDLHSLARQEAQRAGTSVLLALSGVDHLEPRADLPAILRQANQKGGGAPSPRGEGTQFIHSSLEGYFASLKAAVPSAQLPTIRGEQREISRLMGGGGWNYLLYNVLSSRIYNKLQNAHAQMLLERWAEPWSALLACQGLDYPGAFLWRAWQWLLENHPHDSIGGCSVDDVHAEMETRFAWASGIAEHVTEERLQLAARSLDLGDVQEREAVLVLFNGVAWDRDEAFTVDIDLPMPYLNRLALANATRKPTLTAETDHPTLLRWRAHEEWGGDSLSLPDTFFRGLHLRPLGSTEEIPLQLESIRRTTVSRDAVAGPPAPVEVTRVCASFRAKVPGYGYRAFAVRPDHKPVKFPSPLHSDNVLENEHLRVVIAPNGTLTVTDKATGQTFRDLAYFEDGGDAGDGYTYSYPMFDRVLNTLGAAPRLVRLADGPAVQRYAIEYDLALPVGLDAERRRRLEQTVICPLRVVVSLAEGSRRLELEITLDNRACDHRLRVAFPSDVAADFSYGEGHFDVVRHRVGHEQVPNEVWIEDAPTTYPQQTWMDVGSGQRALCLANLGIHEFEVRDTERHEIALTLLRAVGFLGAGRDPMTIMGGAGPKIPTPGGQCLRELTYRLAVIPHAGSWDEAEVWREAHAFVAGVRAVSFDLKDRTLFGKDGAGARRQGSDTSRSLLRVTGKNAVLSAIKGCDRDSGDRRDLIVRLFNPGESATAARLTFARRVRMAHLTNLDEEPQTELSPAGDGSLAVSLGPKKVVTVKVVL